MGGAGQGGAMPKESERACELERWGEGCETEDRRGAKVGANLEDLRKNAARLKPRAILNGAEITG